MPDLTVPMRSADFFARHDPVLAAALARWNGAPPAPSGDVIAVNGASFRVEQGLAPGSFASAFGTFPAGVDGIQVNGANGRILAGSTAQINFVVPDSVATGTAVVSVRAGNREIARGQTTITTSGPGLFVIAADPSQPGAVLNQDNSVNGTAARAPRGSIIQIFATGYSTGSVQVLAGGAPADVLYSGAVQQYPGLWQINARLPDGLTGQIPLYVISGTVPSNAVTLWIE
jgi:uncharacterized protein (TIGR03437 family)